MGKKSTKQRKTDVTNYEYGKGGTGYGDPLYNVKAVQNEHFIDNGEHGNQKKKADATNNDENMGASRGYRHTGKSSFGGRVSSSRGGSYEDENAGSASRGRSASDE